MQTSRKLFLRAVALATLTAAAWAQTEKPHAAATPEAAVSAADFQALKDGLAAALQKIKALQDELLGPPSMPSSDEGAFGEEHRAVGSEQESGFGAQLRRPVGLSPRRGGEK